MKYFDSSRVGKKSWLGWQIKDFIGLTDKTCEQWKRNLSHNHYHIVSCITMIATTTTITMSLALVPTGVSPPAARDGGE